MKMLFGIALATVIFLFLLLSHNSDEFYVWPRLGIPEVLSALNGQEDLVWTNFGSM
jgi:hypothetical protein